MQTSWTLSRSRVQSVLLIKGGDTSKPTSRTVAASEVLLGSQEMERAPERPMRSTWRTSAERPMSRRACWPLPDCACSKTVAGQPWQGYVRCHNPFNVLGKHFVVTGLIVNGEAPLLLSPASLGLLYDIAGHKASFEQLGIHDYKLRFTQTGHPALPVQPSFPPGYKSLTPKDWENPELKIISQTCEQYTAFMTVASGSEQCDVRGGRRADGSGSHFEPSTSAPKTISQDSTMFFSKKVGEVVCKTLTQERLNNVLFCKWWANTKITSDFWIETPEAFFRIHVIPRRGVFDPSRWRTP